jgi:uncharacterized membrane protein
MVPAAPPTKRPVGLALFLVLVGVAGFGAAFALTLDKFALLEDPGAQLSCNFSVLIGCSTNLSSWQGEVFGFPNPLIGVAGWSVVITSAAAILAGARLARWFWIGLNLGLAGALAFVIFLIVQSIYVLDVLCPWCMLTWAATIPAFVAVTLYNLTSGTLPAPASVRRVATRAYRWSWLVTIALYLVVAVAAQVQMDWLHRI